MASYDNIINITKNAVRGGAAAAGTVNSIINAAKGGIKSSSYIRDLYTNGFLSNDSMFKPMVFNRAFDEPTYLTFRIEFDFDDFDGINDTRPFGVGDASYNTTIENKDYMYNFNHMPEPFLILDKFGECGCKVIPRHEKRKYSTLVYLWDNLGEYDRSYLLAGFINRLKDIQYNFPYYFKSLNGLDSLTRITPDEGIRLKDAHVEIECDESIDLKITQLLQTYRKIVWDDVYQRWALPDMMRYFRMKIYVSEIRLFHESRNTIKNDRRFYEFDTPEHRNITSRYNKVAKIVNNVQDAINKATAVSINSLGTESTVSKALNTADYISETASDIGGDIINAFYVLADNGINSVMPTICFDCHMCEFDISETFSEITSLHSSNGEGPITQKLKIKIGNVKETHSYPLSSIMYTGGNGVGKFEGNGLVGINDGYIDRQPYSHVIDDELLNIIPRNAIDKTGDTGNITHNLSTLIKQKNIADNFVKGRYPSLDTENNMLNRMDEDTLSYYSHQPNPMQLMTIEGIAQTATNVATSAMSIIGPAINKNSNKKQEINKNIYEGDEKIPFSPEIERPYDDETYNPYNIPLTNIYDDEAYRYSPKIERLHDGGYKYNPEVENPYGDESYKYNPNIERLVDGKYQYNPKVESPYGDENYKYNPEVEKPYKDEGYHYNPEVESPYGDKRYQYNPDIERPYGDESYKYNPNMERPYEDDKYQYNPNVEKPYDDESYNPEADAINPYLDELIEKATPEMKRIYEEIKKTKNELTNLWVNIYNDPIVLGTMKEKGDRKKLSEKIFYNIVSEMDENAPVGDIAMAEMLKNTRNILKDYISGSKSAATDENNKITTQFNYLNAGK